MATTHAPELLIILGASATQEQIDDVVARLEEAGCSAQVNPGKEATVIGAIGERELLAARRSRAIRVSNRCSRS